MHKAIFLQNFQQLEPIPFWVEGSASSSVIRWVLAIMSNVLCSLPVQGSFERTEESELFIQTHGEEMVGRARNQWCFSVALQFLGILLRGAG